MRNAPATELNRHGLDAFANPARATQTGRCLLVHGALDTLDDPALTAIRDGFVAADTRIAEVSCAGNLGLEPLRLIGEQLLDRMPGSASESLRRVLDQAFARPVDPALGPLLLRSGGCDSRRESIRRALGVAAEAHPTLIIVRDLDAASPELVDVLEYLLSPPEVPEIHQLGPAVRRPAWVLTLRDDGPRAAEYRRRLLENSAVTGHTVRPLDAAELARLMAEPALASRLATITEGRCDRLRELVGLLPESLDELATLRLSALAPPDMSVLRFAALVGYPLGAEVLAALAGGTRLQVARLVQLELLQSTPDGVSLNPLWQTAISDESWAGPEQHRACAHALEGRTETDAVLRRARHHRLAGDLLVWREIVGGALDGLVDAGRYERAADISARAAALDDDPSWVLRTVDLEIRLGRLEAALERLEPALGRTSDLDVRHAHLLRSTGQLEAAETALRRLSTSDLPERLVAPVAIELATTLLRRGDIDAAEVICEAQAATEEPSIRAELQAIAGHIAYRRAEWSAAEAAYTEVTELADNPRLVGAAKHNLGLVALARGEHRRAADTLTDAIATIQSAGDHLLAAAAMHNLGVCREYLQQFPLAEEQFRRSIEILERLGQRDRLANAVSSLADLHLTLGETWRARKLLGYARRLAKSTGQTAVEAIALRRLALAELLDDHPERADELAHDALTVLTELGHAAEVDAAWLLIARIAATRGDRAGARKALIHVQASTSDEIRARGRIVAAMLGDRTSVEAADEAAAAGDWLMNAGLRDGAAEAWAVAGALLETDSPKQSASYRAKAQAAFETLVANAGDNRRAALERTPAGRALSRPAARRRSPQVPSGRRPLVRTFHGMVGACAAMTHCFEMTRKVANSNAPILILGESGTGKERVAEALHRESSRASGPFVRVNAAAFVDSLLESELFGHERGAFTGANQRRVGAFELAHRGTLFLDEIGDISPRTQVALLRALQEGEIRRVGGTQTVKVDVRVVCATNHDLERRVQNGEFRLDLYYRIRGVTIELPALRDRNGDIQLIATHLLERMAERDGRLVQLSDDAQALLDEHEWPGNIRELENVLMTGRVFADSGVITADTLVRTTNLGQTTAAYVTESDGTTDDPLPEGFDLRAAQRDLEMRYITQALRETNGNITHAAERLGYKRPRLSQKIKEYGLRSYLGNA